MANHLVPSPDSAQPGDGTGAWWEPLVAREGERPEQDGAEVESGTASDDVARDT